MIWKCIYFCNLPKSVFPTLCQFVPSKVKLSDCQREYSNLLYSAFYPIILYKKPANSIRHEEMANAGDTPRQPYMDELRQVAEARTIPAKTILLREGRVAHTLYLIRKGCLRLFFYKDGRDITFQFFFEGDFVASFESMHQQRPSLFYLESIEPTEAYAIRKDDFYALIERTPGLRTAYEEKLIERFHAYQQLFLSRIKNTPQQRYEELLATRPDIVRRVPQHYIASYLGITPVSLSRIRNRI